MTVGVCQPLYQPLHQPLNQPSHSSTIASIIAFINHFIIHCIATEKLPNNDAGILFCFFQYDSSYVPWLMEFFVGGESCNVSRGQVSGGVRCTTVELFKWAPEQHHTIPSHHTIASQNNRMLPNGLIARSPLPREKSKRPRSKMKARFL